ncbi:1223_t:CDS:2 [Ambispora leptoticha]|uniref:1223_t:CDS:1 n=1 Tax=Ambispora leptoticha TaxID=144679 RepID=A0A9N8ZQZ2_9GLOM|nr:1223_t:CDS:2 [Ambispora leptoticha]
MKKKKKCGTPKAIQVLRPNTTKFPNCRSYNVTTGLTNQNS